jgi:hypothetical protein
MPYQKVTMLDDLPDLDTLEPSTIGRGFGKPNDDEGFSSTISRRFIRPSHSAHPQSGMTFDEQEIIQPTYERRPVEEISIQRGASSAKCTNFSCQDIYYHIDDCPMCKKFYKNDNSIYLIVIVILILVCGLLLKKVLNV